MTLALAFESGAQTVHWQLGIDTLDAPLVVVPSDTDTVFDMSLVRAGLRALDPEEAGVPEAAVREALGLTAKARDAAIAHAKATSLKKLPDLDSPAVRAVGWKWISRNDLLAWRDQLVSDVTHSAAPVYIAGPAAEAARLGLQTLAERGDAECDPECLAAIAGAVAAKYSGEQVLGPEDATEALRSTTAELKTARDNGDEAAMQVLHHSLGWIADHMSFA